LTDGVEQPFKHSWFTYDPANPTFVYTISQSVFFGPQAGFAAGHLYKVDTTNGVSTKITETPLLNTTSGIFQDFNNGSALL
jgi:hypothetical protein